MRLVYILLLILIMLGNIHCQTTTILRGTIDSIKSDDLPSKIWEFQCINGRGKCQCYYSLKTIYSKNGLTMKCQKDAPCGNLVQLYSPSMTVRGSKPIIKSIEFWNLKGKTAIGVWEDKTRFVKDKYISMSGNNLNFKDAVVKNNWKGQLFKITFTDQNIKCITVKVGGQIVYPFNFDNSFQPFPPTTTTTTKTSTTTTTTKKLTTVPSTTTLSTAKPSTTSTTTTTTTTIKKSSIPTAKPSTTSSSTTTTKKSSIPTAKPSTTSSTKASSTTTKSSSTTKSSITGSTTTKSQSPQSTATDPTLSTSIATGSPSTQGQQNGEDDNLTIYIALGVVCVVVVILLIVVFVLCRKRNSVLKGKSVNVIELKSNDGARPPLKTSHLKGNENEYSYADSATIQQRPNPRSLPSNRGSAPTLTLPSQQSGFYETIGMNNEYLQPCDVMDTSPRPRHESVLSATSQSSLIGHDSPMQERPTYAPLKNAPYQDNLYTGLKPIEENYEQLQMNQHTNDSTYQDIKQEQEPEYREIYSDKPYSFDNPGEANTTDTYAPLRNDTFISEQQNYASLDAKPAEVNDMSNPAYEYDGFYRVLEN